MLEVIELNFNIKSNELAKIKTESDMIWQNLTIFQKLLKIFNFVTLINLYLENYQYIKIRGKKVKTQVFCSFEYLLKRSYILIKRQYNNFVLYILVIIYISYYLLFVFLDMYIYLLL